MMIWLPKSVEIELAHRVAVAGQYRCVISEADGAVAADTGWFDNIITNYGLSQLGRSIPIGTAVIGTGTSPAAATDTTLQAFVAASNGSAPGGGVFPPGGAQNTTSPYETGVVVGYRFGIGTLDGTFAELGVSANDDGTNLFSRSIIVNSSGTPTPIVVNATQQLDVFYRLFRYAPLVDISNSISIGGVTYEVTGRASSAGNPSLWSPQARFAAPINAVAWSADAVLGDVTSAPSATVTSPSTGRSSSYIDGNTSVDHEVTFSTDFGNFAGGIGAVSWIGESSRACSFQYLFDSPIPKDATKTLALQFRVSWGRRP